MTTQVIWPMTIDLTRMLLISTNSKDAGIRTSKQQNIFQWQRNCSQSTSQNFHQRVKFMTLLTHDSGYFASQRRLLSYDAWIVSSTTTRARLTVASKNCSGHKTEIGRRATGNTLEVNSASMLLLLLLPLSSTSTSWTLSLHRPVFAPTWASLFPRRRRKNNDVGRSTTFTFLRKQNFGGRRDSNRNQKETWLSRPYFFLEKSERNRDQRSNLSEHGPTSHKKIK